MHLSALALHPIRVTETGRIEDLPFYKLKRFTKVNTSKKSVVIMAHLRGLVQQARQPTDQVWVAGTCSFQFDFSLNLSWIV